MTYITAAAKPRTNIVRPGGERMRQLIIKPNPSPTDANPAKYHTHLRLEDGTEPRLKLAGFSYFGDGGGDRHLPVDPVPLLYTDRNTPNWEDVIQDREGAVRAT